MKKTIAARATPPLSPKRALGLLANTPREVKRITLAATPVAELARLRLRPSSALGDRRRARDALVELW